MRNYEGIAAFEFQKGLKKNYSNSVFQLCIATIFLPIEIELQFSLLLVYLST